MLGIVFPADLLQSASVAYIHYLSFMLCFGALLFERISLKVDPNRQEAISMVIACLLYTSPSPRDGLLSRMPSSA